MAGGFIELVQAKVINNVDSLVSYVFIKAVQSGFQIDPVFLPAKILPSSVYWLVFSSLLSLILTTVYYIYNQRTSRYIPQFCTKGNS